MKRLLIAALVLAALGALVVVVIGRGSQLPDEPVPVAWDKDVCGHCHMHVGDPRYAAQLVTTDGDVVFFDDVGCALSYLQERKPSVHRLWFHGEGDRWIAADHVGFIEAGATPMGSGLIAVERGAPGARSLEEVMR